MNDDAANNVRGRHEAALTNRDGSFPATRWSVVYKTRSADPAAGTALAELCRVYWRPVYSYLRRQGSSTHDAEDLTQGFFVMLLDQELFATVDEARGRLRSFLLVALKHYVANEYKRGQRQKRGGGDTHVPIDLGDAEESYAVELATGLAPDLLFERQWTLTLLQTVLAKLQDEYALEGRENLFHALKDRFSADDDPSAFATVAAQLSMTEGAVKVAAHRMRQRYKRILRSEIALTVDSPREVDEEIVHLFKVFQDAR